MCLMIPTCYVAEAQTNQYYLYPSTNYVASGEHVYMLGKLKPNEVVRGTVGFSRSYNIVFSADTNGDVYADITHVNQYWCSEHYDLYSPSVGEYKLTIEYEDGNHGPPISHIDQILVQATNGVYQVTMLASMPAGFDYFVEASPALEGPWSQVGSEPFFYYGVTNWTYQFTVSSPQQYYRIKSSRD